MVFCRSAFFYFSFFLPSPDHVFVFVFSLEPAKWWAAFVSHSLVLKMEAGCSTLIQLVLLATGCCNLKDNQVLTYAKRFDVYYFPKIPRNGRHETNGHQSQGSFWGDEFWAYPMKRKLFINQSKMLNCCVLSFFISG
jgi:hypothetical protein